MNPHRRGDIAHVQGISCAEGNITPPQGVYNGKSTCHLQVLFLVDLVGLEPMTSALRTQRSPN